MKILVIGADGYLGRPTIENLDHKVVGIDNYIKRILMFDNKVRPLVETYKSQALTIDITQYDEFSSLIKREKFDVIIHYGEIPSAPYSMIDRNSAVKTISNNLIGTINLIYAIRDYSPETHLIKLGTLGEYGTPNIDIEEGWLQIEHNGRTDRLLYPKTPGSMYHLSKVHDSDALAFACRMWGLRVTDLNQGFVYGPSERFCYDHIFGTALNRFIVQSVAGHPLTVYGEGTQTRGILNIQDTIQCVKLALENPAKAGEFRVFNQFTEQKSVLDLANLVKKVTGCKINHIENPRKESQSHYYNVKNKNLKDLGFDPKYLTEETIEEMVSFVEQYKDNIQVNQIFPNVRWV